MPEFHIKVKYCHYGASYLIHMTLAFTCKHLVTLIVMSAVILCHLHNVMLYLYHSVFLNLMLCFIYTFQSEKDDTTSSGKNKENGQQSQVVDTRSEECGS